MEIEEITYKRAETAVFRKTAEEFGGLSNMAAGYPLRVNGVPILTSEALYQACRFPQNAEAQKTIIDQPSPMGAKMKSKPYRKDSSRRDWERVNVRIMRWCLRVKLAQNWVPFSRLLRSTGQRPIVEESHRDKFWGATVQKDGTLRGANLLGRLLTELRDDLDKPHAKGLRRVEPVPLADFLFYGKPIATIQPPPELAEVVDPDTAPPEGALWLLSPSEDEA